jgi:hypothetical protein
VRPVFTSLLHKHSAIAREQQDVHATMPESALMDDRSHFLTDHLIVFVYDIE